jgi:hypothetical protein
MIKHLNKILKQPNTQRCTRVSKSSKKTKKMNKREWFKRMLKARIN